MSPHRINRLLALCASAALVSFATAANAADRFWNNAAGGSFNVPGNWQGGFIPGASDRAWFSMDIVPGYTVNFPANVTNDSVRISDDVTFDLQSHQYQLTSPPGVESAGIEVGYAVGDNAIFHLRNGALLASYTNIGHTSGSNDSAFIGTSAVLNSTTVDIGHYGIGHLRVENGGIITSTNALLATGAGAIGTLTEAHATVSGAGSRWNNSAAIIIGNGRVGFFTVENGGLVFTDDAIITGTSSTLATSTLSVTGANSRFTVNDDMEVGTAATPTGVMNISAGGAVLITDVLNVRGTASIANAASSLHTRVIKLFGGTLNHTGGNIQASTGGSLTATGIFVGLAGTGAVEVAAGAHLNTTGIASLGELASGSGSVSIFNAGSNWTHAGEISVGVSGSGTFSISSGATFANTGLTGIGRSNGSTGSVSIQGAGSRWDTRDIYVGQNGLGSIAVTNSAVLFNQNAFMGYTPAASSFATVFDPGSLWNTTGSLYVGGHDFGPGGSANIDLGVSNPGGTIAVSNLIKVWPAGRINQNSGELRSAALNIQGGAVTQSGGLIQIDSAISPFTLSGINIGINGTGTLNISAGGRLATAGEAYVGVYAASTGDIIVDGPGSRWTTNSLLVVGDAGKGILTIDNGALVSAAGDGYIGFVAGSTGSVTVDGASATDASTLTIGGNLDVGTLGTAFLSITNQASVSSRDSFVGRSAGSKGTVKITDNNADWRCTTLFIGGDAAGPGGIGTVNVANNGVLNVTGPITVWQNGVLQSYPVSISTSELRLRGGKFSAWGNVGAPINSGGGTIEVPGSNMLFLNNTLTSLGGSLLTRIGTGDLHIMGPQNHAANSTYQARGGQTFLGTNAGTPATAAAAATANLNVIVGPEPAKIVQLTNQVFRRLGVSHASPGRQAYDLNSPVAPGGFAALSVYDTAIRSDLFAAIGNANRAGAPDPQDGIFDSHLSSHPNSRIGIAKLSDLHGDSYLLIRPTRIGDLNLDGGVTISDFIDLAANFGAAGVNITWQEGDLNYDNAVTISDFIDLAANFGSSYSGAVQPSAVPEPSAVCIIAPGLLLAVRRRRPAVATA